MVIALPICRRFEKQAACRALSRASKHGKEQRGEDGDNSDDDEQLDERERCPAGSVHSFAPYYACAHL
jgi:hypothetical protein